MKLIGMLVVACGYYVASFQLACAADRPQPLLNVDFESFELGTNIAELDGWSAFRGFRADTPPQVAIRDGLGVDGSMALTVAHTETFRADNWGVQRAFAEPIAEGVVWIDARFRTPREGSSGFYFDARAGRQVVGRIAAVPYTLPDEEDGQAKGKQVLRMHASWTRSYWRMYRNIPLNAGHWYQVTMRIDLDRGAYAAWIDDYVLGEELPLCSREPIDHLHLGFGGTPDEPAAVDNLRVSRDAPEGRSMPALLPEPEADLAFRMAVVGDPQIGFTDYEADKIRFREAVEQINRSGAELTIVLGDMVHDNDDEQAYRDLAELGGRLKQPVYYIRGNHEHADWFQKHFHPELDYSFIHQGMRFVVINAIGNLTGLSDEQLTWIEEEFAAASKAGEELVVSLHVSPWQDNERGRGSYNQIGPGRDRLRELMKEHRAVLCFSGHYHRGLWHAKEELTHYMVLGGTSLVKHGHTGWCVMDVYPDRIVIHEKPLFFSYEKPDSKEFYNFPYSRWTSYTEARKQYPYLQQGPAEIKRLRPSNGGKR